MQNVSNYMHALTRKGRRCAVQSIAAPPPTQSPSTDKQGTQAQVSSSHRTTAVITACAIADDISGPATADTSTQQASQAQMMHAVVSGAKRSVTPEPAKHRDRDTKSSLRLPKSFITLFTGNIINSSSCMVTRNTQLLSMTTPPVLRSFNANDLQLQTDERGLSYLIQQYGQCLVPHLLFLKIIGRDKISSLLVSKVYIISHHMRVQQLPRVFFPVICCTRPGDLKSVTIELLTCSRKHKRVLENETFICP